jgi:FMN phosphatase YigB (HAD superfamily)
MQLTRVLEILMSSDVIIKHILFDVADTLLHKPLLIPKVEKTLLQHGYVIPRPDIQRAHRAVREAITFPDRTDKEFYLGFNLRFLAVLGIMPSARIVEDIYLNCRELEWEPFDDVVALKSINMPIGIVSNWDVTLPQKLMLHGLDFFSPTLCSEAVGVAKPDLAFYCSAADCCGVLPEQILYIGDSISLDMEPSSAVGMQPVLLDRYGLSPHYSGYRISTLGELVDLPFDCF